MMIAPFSYMGNSYRSSGTDGDLYIPSGTTVTLSSGVTKNYNSITIDAGGTLRIEGTGQISYIASRRPVILNGTIKVVGQKQTWSTSGTDPWLGTYISWIAAQASGGNGGRGAGVTVTGAGIFMGTVTSSYNTLPSSTSGGNGGAGSGGTAIYWAGNLTGATGGQGGNGGVDGQTPSSNALTGLGYVTANSRRGYGALWNENVSYAVPGTNAIAQSASLSNRPSPNWAYAYTVGGDGGSGGAGGGGGNVTSNGAYYAAVSGSGWDACTVTCAGGGGGAGGARGTHGGILFLLCEFGIYGSGIIDASGGNGVNGGNGGNGADSGTGTYPSNYSGYITAQTAFGGGGGGGGGGAGGSGGYICIRYRKQFDLTNPNSLMYNGGSGGTGGVAGGTAMGAKTLTNNFTGTSVTSLIKNLAVNGNPGTSGLAGAVSIASYI